MLRQDSLEKRRRSRGTYRMLLYAKMPLTCVILRKILQCSHSQFFKRRFWGDDLSISHRNHDVKYPPESGGQRVVRKYPLPQEGMTALEEAEGTGEAALYSHTMSNQYQKHYLFTPAPPFSPAFREKYVPRSKFVVCWIQNHLVQNSLRKWILSKGPDKDSIDPSIHPQRRELS